MHDGNTTPAAVQREPAFSLLMTKNDQRPSNVARPIHCPSARSHRLTAADLFCGIGGFHIAAAQNDVEVIFACDIAAAAAACYEANLHLTPHGDIAQCKDEIPPHDILLAGFPCQDFSIMGKGQGLQGEHGSHVLEVAEITSLLQPAAVVMENVKRLTTHDQGGTIKLVEEAFNDLGYLTEHRVLNARDFGLPQQRERTFIVALQKGSRPLEWPAPTRSTSKLREVLVKGRVPNRYYASKQIQENRRKSHTPSIRGERLIWHENKAGQVNSLPYSCALMSSASHNYLLVDGKRRLTEREMLNLQGFPQEYQPQGSYTQTKSQAGNAVPVPVAAAVIKAVKTALEV